MLKKRTDFIIIRLFKEDKERLLKQATNSKKRLSAFIRNLLGVK